MKTETDEVFWKLLSEFLDESTALETCKHNVISLRQVCDINYGKILAKMCRVSDGACCGS